MVIEILFQSDFKSDQSVNKDELEKDSIFTDRVSSEIKKSNKRTLFMYPLFHNSVNHTSEGFVNSLVGGISDVIKKLEDH